MRSGKIGARGAGTRVVRLDEYVDPPVAGSREVLTAGPLAGRPGTPPPVLLVPGLGHGAWAYAEHWLASIADRGFPVSAMDLARNTLSGRGGAGHDDLRGYANDVVQVAAGLPRQAVLVGHGVGALVVAMAMGRYPARAGVLVCPVFGGLGTAMTMVRRNPAGAMAALLNRPVPPSVSQLLGPAMPQQRATAYLDRLDRGGQRTYRQLIRRRSPERPVGDPPVLVIGSPDDRVVPRAELDRVAQGFGCAPLLFPGMAHDLMLDDRWAEPVEALLEWLVARCWPKHTD